MNNILRFTQFINENFSEDYTKLMSTCVEYQNYIDENDSKIENRVKNLIKPLLDKQEYDEAKHLTKQYYMNARVNRKGNVDKEGDVFLLGYDDIYRSINQLKFDKASIEDFTFYEDNTDYTDVIKKCVEYNKFILKSGHELNQIIAPKIKLLLSENKNDDAIETLNNFFDSSFRDKDKRFSVFIEYDMLKAMIIRAKNQNKQ